MSEGGCGLSARGARPVLSTATDARAAAVKLHDRTHLLMLQELADAVFGEYLAEHLALELAWLQQGYDTTAADRGLSLQHVTEFFEWNKEARPPSATSWRGTLHAVTGQMCLCTAVTTLDRTDALDLAGWQGSVWIWSQHQVSTNESAMSAKQAVERCKVLCTEVTCPTAVRQLFHSSTVERANQGCLLEQVRFYRPNPNSKLRPREQETTCNVQPNAAALAEH